MLLVSRLVPSVPTLVPLESRLVPSVPSSVPLASLVSITGTVLLNKFILKSLPLSNNSGSGKPKALASLKILGIPVPHASIKVRYAKTSAMPRFLTLEIPVFSCSTVMLLSKLPGVVTSKRSSKTATCILKGLK